MLCRVRVSAILIENEKVLLVKHVHPKTGFTWWVPPGGGLENKDKNIYECVIRETWEETGYNIIPCDILYIREFLHIESNTLNLEIYIKGNIESGNLTIANCRGNGIDEDYIKDAKWLSQNDIAEIVVFPEIIKANEFWADKNNEKLSIKYLNRQEG